MRFKIYYLLMFYSVLSFAQIPKDFVYLVDVIPNIKIELRYFSANNFIGKPIEGYNANKLILTKNAALSLIKVQEDLEANGYCLKVFDAYRPQRAVNHFVRWAENLNDTINKQVYYPKVKKKDLFNEGYIASRSGHTRGSTLDLTIINKDTNMELDMGSPYDFFGTESWVNYKGISKKQIANRELLQTVMIKHGFINYPKEWWHFTLKNEPFPDTYFDFVVE